jgi:RNA polymerase sigma-70 factor, ECF subfamily
MSRLLGAYSLASRRQIDSATEAALVEQCRRQDFEAFSRIVDAYQSRVFGFVRRMVRDEEEALDLTQDVFVKAFQGVGKFDGRSSLRTWLFRIAHNLCVDRSRRLGRVPTEASLDFEADDESVEPADGRWNPEQIVLDDELTGVVERAGADMSDKLRTVLLLHDREDMGYEEIAKTVDVPVGTVKSRLFLARAHVQKVVGTYLEARGNA